mgnify:CR=1 FL=1
MSLQGYCLKCKDKKEMVNGETKTNKRGGRYMSGLCLSCNCKMNVFLKKKKSFFILTKLNKCVKK